MDHSQVTRKFDAAPAFRNDILGPFKGKAPYTKGQTYADPNPDREEFLNKTQGLNMMQKVSRRALVKNTGATILSFD